MKSPRKMNTHIFKTSSDKVYLVEAESETEAKGIMFDGMTVGMKPDYQGTVEELKNDNDIVEI